MKILDRLPFSDRPHVVSVGPESVDIHRNQIIAWISINDARRPFPAILDTGHGHNLSIGRQQLDRWAGAITGPIGELDINGKPVLQYTADVRIHRNVPGRAELSGGTYDLEMPQGISVMGEGAPRLPLIGLRTLVANKLRLVLDGERREVTPKTKGWRRRAIVLPIAPAGRLDGSPQARYCHEVPNGLDGGAGGRMVGLVVILGLVVGAQVSPRAAIVTDATLEVFDAPDPGALPTGSLRRGQKVVVEREDPGGWLAIRPPGGSFSWIEEGAIEADDGEDGQARVIHDDVAVRPGRPGAKLPGPAQMTLEQGTTVVLVDRPKLVLGTGRSARTWVAIEPPAGEFRFVAAEGVELVETSPRRPGRPIRNGDDPAPAPAPANPAVDPRLRDDLQRIESLHRAAVSGPVDQWNLDRVRTGYTNLLDRVNDEDTRQVIRQRIAQVDRQKEIVRTAGGFLTRLRASRSRDDDLSRFRQGLDKVAMSANVRFVAQGLLEPSSVEFEGHRLYALFGRDGKLSAYLDLPPGLVAKPLVGRKVGVLGEARYREALPVRVIEVRDLEALDQAP